MSKSFARIRKHKFYWTDSAVNSLRQGIFTFSTPPHPPSSWFYNKAAADSADMPCSFHYHFKKLFFSKGEWWLQGEECHQKQHFFFASHLDSPSHWGDTNDSTMRGKRRRKDPSLLSEVTCAATTATMAIPREYWFLICTNSELSSRSRTFQEDFLRGGQSARSNKLCQKKTSTGMKQKVLFVVPKHLAQQHSNPLYSHKLEEKEKRFFFLTYYRYM